MTVRTSGSLWQEDTLEGVCLLQATLLDCPSPVFGQRFGSLLLDVLPQFPLKGLDFEGLASGGADISSVTDDDDKINGNRRQG